MTNKFDPKDPNEQQEQATEEKQDEAKATTEADGDSQSLEGRGALVD